MLFKGRLLSNRLILVHQYYQMFFFNLFLKSRKQLCDLVKFINFIYTCLRLMESCLIADFADTIISHALFLFYLFINYSLDLLQISSFMTSYNISSTTYIHNFIYSIMLNKSNKWGNNILEVSLIMMTIRHINTIESANPFSPSRLLLLKL